MKRLIALLAVAALASAAAVSARTAAPPTLTPGTLTVAFGDPAVGFAVGTVRGGTITNPRGYEVDLAKAIAAQLGITTIKWVYTPWTGLFSPGNEEVRLLAAGGHDHRPAQEDGRRSRPRTSTPTRAC